MSGSAGVNKNPAASIKSLFGWASKSFPRVKRDSDLSLSTSIIPTAPDVASLNNFDIFLNPPPITPATVPSASIDSNASEASDDTPDIGSSKSTTVLTALSTVSTVSSTVDITSPTAACASTIVCVTGAIADWTAPVAWVTAPSTADVTSDSALLTISSNAIALLTFPDIFVNDSSTTSDTFDIASLTSCGIPAKFVTSDNVLLITADVAAVATLKSGFAINTWFGIGVPKAPDSAAWNASCGLALTTWVLSSNFGIEPSISGSWESFPSIKTPNTRAPTWTPR